MYRDISRMHISNCLVVYVSLVTCTVSFGKNDISISSAKISAEKFCPLLFSTYSLSGVFFNSIDSEYGGRKKKERKKTKKKPLKQ